MYLNDFLQESIVESEEELIRLLKTRRNHSVNHFILTHDESGFPQLNIFAKGDAFVLYCMAAGENHVSTGNHSTPEETCLFYENDGGAKVALPCACIVEKQEMETAAWAFFRQKSRPESLRWQKL